MKGNEQHYHSVVLTTLDKIIPVSCLRIKLLVELFKVVTSLSR